MASCPGCKPPVWDLKPSRGLRQAGLGRISTLLLPSRKGSNKQGLSQGHATQQHETQPPANINTETSPTSNRRISTKSRQSLSVQPWQAVLTELQHAIKQGSAASTVSRLQSQIADLGPNDLASLAQQFGKLARQDRGVKAVSDAVLSKVFSRFTILGCSSFDLAHLSRILAGCVGAQYQPPSTVTDMIAETLLERQEALAPGDWSKNAWHFTTLRANPLNGRYFEVLARHMCGEGVLASWQNKELTMTFWSFAKSRQRIPADVLDGIIAKVAHRVEHFGPQELSNTVWSLATLAHRPADALFLDRLALAALASLERFKPQELSNTAWAFASLRHVPKDIHFFDALASEASAKLQAFTPQELSNTVWAFATVRHCPADVQFLDAIAAAALPKLQSFKPQEFSNILWAFAKLNHDPLDGKFYDVVADAAFTKLHLFDAQALSNSVWAFATLGRVPANDEFLHHLADTALVKLHKFKPQELSNMVWAFAKLDHVPANRAFLDAIASAASRKLQGFATQDLGNVLWAFATLGYMPSSQFLGALVSAARPKLPLYKPQELSNTVWAFATLNQLPADAGFLDALVESALAQLQSFKPQELSNTMWALARLCYRPSSSSCLDMFAAAALAKLPEFKPQELSNLVWAFAKFGHKPVDEAFLDSVAATVAPKLLSFKPQELSNTVWAFAKLDHMPAVDFLDATVSASWSQLQVCPPQNLSNTLWAMATLGYMPSSTQYLDAVAASALSKLQAFKPQEISNIIWAFGTLGYNPLGGRFLQRIIVVLETVDVLDVFKLEDFSQILLGTANLSVELPLPLLDKICFKAFSRFAACCSQPLHDEGPSVKQTFPITLWALSQHRHRPDVLCRDGLLDRLLLHCMDGMELKGIPQVLLSVAKLRLPLDHQVLVQLEHRATKFAKDGGEEALCMCSNVLWSLACMDARPSREFLQAAGQVVSKATKDGDDIDARLLTQLWQACMAFKANGEPLNWLPSTVDIERGGWMMQDANVSREQRQVAEVVKRLGMPCFLESRLSNHNISVDIAIPGTPDVAIEFDGPSHYTCNQPYVLLGHTVLRNRLLCIDGWEVVTVPFFEWSRLSSDEAKMAYLQRKLSVLRTA